MPALSLLLIPSGQRWVWGEEQLPHQAPSGARNRSRLQEDGNGPEFLGDRSSTWPCKQELVADPRKSCGHGNCTSQRGGARWPSTPAARRLMQRASLGYADRVQGRPGPVSKNQTWGSICHFRKRHQAEDPACPLEAVTVERVFVSITGYRSQGDISLNSGGP